VQAANAHVTSAPPSPSLPPPPTLHISNRRCFVHPTHLHPPPSRSPTEEFFQFNKVFKVLWDKKTKEGKIKNKRCKITIFFAQDLNCCCHLFFCITCTGSGVHVQSPASSTSVFEIDSNPVSFMRSVKKLTKLTTTHPTGTVLSKS